ncbi:MAG: hypothetical protein ACK5LO_07510 [Leucobacter sp.]
MTPSADHLSGRSSVKDLFAERAERRIDDGEDEEADHPIRIRERLRNGGVRRGDVDERVGYGLPEQRRHERECHHAASAKIKVRESKIAEFFCNGPTPI